MTTPLDRDRLRRAFELVDRELVRRGARAELKLAGGAVMALLYDADRVTRDVDGLVVEGHGPLVAAARSVAAELHLPPGWLNEGVSAYLSARSDRTIPVYDGPALSVHAVSIEHMIALKARRAWAQDLADLRVLADVAGIAASREILHIVDQLFPDDPITERARAAVEDEFDGPAGGGVR